MKLQEVRKFAKKMGLDTAKLTKDELIRYIQVEEGNIPVSVSAKHRNAVSQCVSGVKAVNRDHNLWQRISIDARKEQSQWHEQRKPAATIPKRSRQGKALSRCNRQF